MFGNPMEIALIVGAAVLLFGADKLPKLARSMGVAKKEFVVGQAEADVAAERVREDARKQAEHDVAASAATTQTNGVGMATPIPDPTTGGTTTTTAPPHSAL